MTKTRTSELLDAAMRWVADRPTIRPSAWAEQNVILTSAEERGAGPLSWHGREFCIEPLDAFADPLVSDIVCCFGSQIGKTVLIMCGIAYLLDCDPSGILWVMPDKELARSFSESRWMPFLQQCRPLAPLIPRGKHRHRFATLKQCIGGTWVNMVGSNSRAGLSSRPKRVVVMDEMDKFPPETRGGEAGAINLAEQRVKDAAMPKRIKTSTPSTSDGPGWVEFLKGDQRRYLVPCPKCGQGVFLAWLKGQSMLTPDPRDAHITWDQSAKKADNTWDLNRVMETARCMCPHCSHGIGDWEKTAMVRAGKWLPTASAPSSFRSYHLPSLYASSPSTSFGALARQWLIDLRSLDGPKGFVNGMLAEPWEAQNERDQRSEAILVSDFAPMPTGSVTLMSIDVQRGQPAFYWVARSWDPDTGNSRRVGFGTCDSWAELDAAQARLGIESRHVVVDSGDGVKQAEIFEACAERSQKLSRKQGRPLCVGWLPARGEERDHRWMVVDAKTGRKTPVPFATIPAKLTHSEYELRVLGFDGPYFTDILHDLRTGSFRGVGIKWEVIADPEKDPEYWNQMDAKIKRPNYHSRTGKAVWEWQRRSRAARDHYLDCEIQCVAFAFFHRLIHWATPKTTR